MGMEGQGRARASEAGLGQAQRHEDDVEAELEERSPGKRCHDASRTGRKVTARTTHTHKTPAGVKQAHFSLHASGGGVRCHMDGNSQCAIHPDHEKKTGETPAQGLTGAPERGVTTRAAAPRMHPRYRRV